MDKRAAGKRSYNWPMRLHVYLARSGVASRRKCEGLIAAGRVRVNDTVVTEQGSKVGPDDRIYLDGREVHITRQKYYVALNKPPRVLCSNHDPAGRPLAIDYVRGYIPVRMFTVGRLDFLSEGLIFLTNDGEFADAVMHPSAGVEKEYVVETKQPVPRELLEEYKAGIRLEGTVYRLKDFQYRNARKVHVILMEGKNREIREVFTSRRIKLKRLKRVRIGSVQLGNLNSGAHRDLTENEVSGFFARAREDHRKPGRVKSSREGRKEGRNRRQRGNSN
ncbi:MAG: pseudouridine synthase [Spirochaetaceae bacterium]